jgi:hypothetical protein
MNKTRLIFACWTVGLVVASCTNAKPDNRLEILDTNIATYYDHLRWGHFEEAASLRNPNSGPPQTVLNEDFKHIHVTNYEVTSKQISLDGDEATIGVNMEYYDDEDGTVHHLRDQHRWVYIAPARRWLNDGDLPVFLKGTGR